MIWSGRSLEATRLGSRDDGNPSWEPELRARVFASPGLTAWRWGIRGSRSPLGSQVKEAAAPPTPTPTPLYSRISVPRSQPSRKGPSPTRGLSSSSLKQETGPRKDWRVLPFDPQEPEARPSWQLLFPDTEQSPGSPRLPGTSREIVWSRGLLSVPISPPDCLESGRGQRIRPGTGKPQEQGLERLEGDVEGGGGGGAGPCSQPFCRSLLLSAKVTQGSWPTEALALAHMVP